MQNKNHKTHLRFEFLVKPERLVFKGMENNLSRFEKVGGDIDERLDELDRRIQKGKQVGMTKENLRSLLGNADKRVEKFTENFQNLKDNPDQLKKITLPEGNIGNESRNLFRTYTFDKIEDFLKSKVESKEIEAKEASQILETIMSGTKVRNKSTEEVLLSSMRMIQYADFLSSEIKKRFYGKNNKAELAKEMEKGEQSLEIKAGGIITIGGKKYQIQEFETLVGAAMSKIDVQLTENFQLTNVLLLGDGTALAQMKNGCGGNLVALKLEKVIPEPIAVPEESPKVSASDKTHLSTFETNPKLKIFPENRLNLPGYFVNVIRSLGLIPAKVVKNLSALSNGVKGYPEKSTNLYSDPVEYNEKGDPIYNERLKDASDYYKIKEINTAETLAEVLGFKNTETVVGFLDRKNANGKAKEFLEKTSEEKLKDFIVKLRRAGELVDENAAAKQMIRQLKKEGGRKKIIQDFETEIPARDKMIQKLRAEGSKEERIKGLEARNVFAKKVLKALNEGNWEGVAQYLEKKTDKKRKELKLFETEFKANKKLLELANYTLGQGIVDPEKNIATQNPLAKIRDRIEREELGRVLLDYEKKPKQGAELLKLKNKMRYLSEGGLSISLARILGKAGVVENVKKRSRQGWFDVVAGFEEKTLQEALDYAKGKDGFSLGGVEFVNVLDLKLGDSKLTADHFDIDILQALEALGIAKVVEIEKEVMDGYDTKKKEIKKSPRKQKKLKVLNPEFKNKTIAEVFEHLKIEREKIEKTIGKEKVWVEAGTEGGGRYITAIKEDNPAGEKALYKLKPRDYKFTIGSVDMRIHGAPDSIMLNHFEPAEVKAFFFGPSPMAHILRLALFVSGIALDFELMENISPEDIKEKFEIGKEEEKILAKLAEKDGVPISEKVAALLFSKSGFVKRPGEHFPVPVGLAQFTFINWGRLVDIFGSKAGASCDTYTTIIGQEGEIPTGDVTF